MHRILLLLLFLAAGITVHAQVAVTWAKSIGGSTGNDVVQSIWTDASGNVYIAGSFNGLVDFDPSGGVTNKTSLGVTDGFVAKYTSAGVLVWVDQFGASGGTTEVYAVTVDGSGNVYVAGYFSAIVDFNPDPVAENKLTSNGFIDAFFGRYSSTGAYVWANKAGSSTDNDYATTISLDASSNLYVGGIFTGTNVDFDPSATVVSRTAVGGDDFWFGKYSINGVVVWVNAMGSANDDGCRALVAVGSNVWVAGYYGQVMNANPAGTASNTTWSGGWDGLFAQYNGTTGVLITGGTLVGTGDEVIATIAADASNVYTGGYFGGGAAAGATGSLFGANSSTTARATAGGRDLFVARHNATTLDLIWMNTAGSPGEDGVDLITLDASSNVYAAGFFEQTIDFDPSTATAWVTAQDDFEAYLAKYSNSTGALNYAFSLGNTNVDEATTVDVDASGNVYLAGLFEVSLDADPGPATTTLTSAGFWDCFFIKYSQLSLAVEPSAPPTVFSATAITSSSFNISFTAPATAPTGYIAVRRAGTAPVGDPVDGTTYTIGAALGGGNVVYADGGTSFGQTGLTADTQYFYKIYAYNGSGTTINYRTTTLLAGNATTLTAGVPEPTAQPTDLIFENITTTSFDYSFTGSTGANVAGHVGIKKTGSAPTFVPSDNVDLVAGATNPDGSVVAFKGTGTDWTLSTATPNTTYYYAIYAYNGSGSTINYLTTSPLTDNVTTLDPSVDLTPPVVTDVSPDFVSPGASFKITVTVTDNSSGVSDVYVTYYPVNSVNQGSGDFTLKSGTTNTWEYTIPATFNTEQGIEYYVQADDNAGNSSDGVWTTVRVLHDNNDVGLTFSAPFGAASTNYRIISIPLDLSKKSVADIFGDDLGTSDKSKYRLFRYNGSANIELSSSGSIELGKGYWFLSSESKTIDTGAGTTANVGVDTPMQIAISNGWNQIGNPFNFSLDWTLVEDDDDNSDKTFGNLRLYTGDFADSDVFPKMTGGFLFVTSQGNGLLEIPVVKDASRKAAPVPVNFAQTLESDTWAVDLILKSGDRTNKFGGFGMHPKASEQSDRYDDYTMPRFIDYLEVNHHKTIFGSNFTKDIVPTTYTHVWEFEVASNLTDEVMEFTWDNSFFGTSDRQLVLWDVNQQRAIDMRMQNRYSFERSQAGVFKVFFGDENFVKTETLPFRAVFHSASPVPSAGNVTLAFSVPETGTQVHTHLFIYNLMGQKIANLVDQPLQGGYQEAVWNIEDGTKPAAGVYISVLKFGDTTLQKRLIIK